MQSGQDIPVHQVGDTLEKASAQRIKYFNFNTFNKFNSIMVKVSKSQIVN